MTSKIDKLKERLACFVKEHSLPNFAEKISIIIPNRVFNSFRLDITESVLQNLLRDKYCSEISHLQTDGYEKTDDNNGYVFNFLIIINA